MTEMAMKRLMVSLTALAAAGALLAGAGSAHASVTVIGCGLAQACSKAALHGSSSYRDELLCTSSLDSELLSPRDRAGTYVNRGIMKLRRMEWDGAMKDFNTALRYKPDLGEIYVNRGAVFIAQHRYTEGLNDLNKGITLGVEEPEKAYYNRALAYEGLDDVKSAYFDYQKALEIAPTWDPPKQQLTRFHVTRRE
jgi:tetratricopeptide (TPR) repeat protein